jgi:hypothetical protein
MHCEEQKLIKGVMMNHAISPGNNEPTSVTGNVPGATDPTLVTWNNIEVTIDELLSQKASLVSIRQIAGEMDAARQRGLGLVMEEYGGKKVLGVIEEIYRNYKGDMVYYQEGWPLIDLLQILEPDKVKRLGLYRRMYEAAPEEMLETWLGIMERGLSYEENGFPRDGYTLSWEECGDFLHSMHLKSFFVDFPEMEQSFAESHDLGSFLEQLKSFEVSKTSELILRVESILAFLEKEDSEACPEELPADSCWDTGYYTYEDVSGLLEELKCLRDEQDRGIKPRQYRWDEDETDAGISEQGRTFAQLMRIIEKSK